MATGLPPGPPLPPHGAQQQQEQQQAAAAAEPGMTSYLLMALVALQVGVQPAVTRACVPQTVSGRSLVLAEMAVSMILALVLVPSDAFMGWSTVESAWLAGPPAAVYAMRSLLKQAAYRRCDGVTFNIFNQTKVVFCAMAAWVLLGEGQTVQQCTALLIAVAAGALLVAPARSNNGRRVGCWGRGAAPARCHEGSGEVNGNQGSSADQKSNLTASVGSMLALGTAACSGLAAALSQAALAGRSRPSALFNLELALWGVPLVLLSGGGAGSESPVKALRGWRKRTLTPVTLQAAGGLLVSAVVKQRGGVAMGLCTVAGIAVSAAVDSALLRRPPSLRQVCAAALCGLSVLMHQLDGRDSPGGQHLGVPVPAAFSLVNTTLALMPGP